MLLTKDSKVKCKGCKMINISPTVAIVLILVIAVIFAVSIRKELK